MIGDFDVMIRALTDDQFDALIRALQGIRQRHKDDVLMREIVADERRRTAQPPTPTVRVVGAGAVVTGGDGAGGRGWVEAKPLDDWQRQVGIGKADALVAAQDRRDSATKRGGR
jgi:hypothetical protein